MGSTRPQDNKTLENSDAKMTVERFMLALNE